MPTAGIVPYGTYTFYNMGVMAQYWDAENNHLGDVAFFDACDASDSSCDFTRTVDHGPLAGVVPEPASWASLLLGIGCIGAAMRGSRRHRMNRLVG